VEFLRSIGGRGLKRIFGSLMLLLVLAGMFSGIFVSRAALAQNSEDRISRGDLGEVNKTTLSSKTLGGESGQGKPYEETALRPPSRDTCDFSNVSEWVGLAYLSGNKTRLIVGIENSYPSSIVQLESVASKHEAKVVSSVSFGGTIRALVVELPLESVSAFTEDVRKVGFASYVEPNLKVQTQFAPNDPYWSQQWGPQRIEADWAWNTTVGSSSVLVAVVDTGIDYTHPDLAANYVPLGYDWVNNDADPLDDFGHGTHCAGIIAAVLNDSVGVAGLAQVHIMSEKVLDSGGFGYWDWVANGIVHAADQGANIISMSLGGYGESELLHDAVKYACDAGVLLIAAAGNDNTNTKFYPAAYDEVVAVVATDQYDYKAYFSNWGDWIELAAPGVSIYSTMPTYPVTLNSWGYAMNYEYLSGTSMACPHVAGVAALFWSLYPNKTREWVRQWLQITVDDLGDPGFDTNYGYGRVNARKAVEQVPPVHDLIAYGGTTPTYVEPGATETINATILNFGESDEADIAVQLLANGTIVDSAVMGLLVSGTKDAVSMEWSPTVEGLYNVTIYAVPVLGETIVENNVLTKDIYVGFPVKAVVLRSYGNVLEQNIINWQALNNEWRLFGDTMIYIDYETLNKENIAYADIAATEADVLIISFSTLPYSYWEFEDSEINAIERYVREGHGLIATGATFSPYVPNNNKLGHLFGLNETTSWEAYRQTDLLHLLNTTHPVLSDVPNPLVFPAVETAIPADGRWDSNELVDGKYLALGHYQESAIVTYKGLIYISPGFENLPPYYHHHLQLLYNAITWSHYEKPAHELAVSLEAPTYVRPGDSVLLNATVNNKGLSNETNVELNLLIDGAVVNSTTFPELPKGESCQISCLWTPLNERAYNLTAYSPTLSGEENLFSNVDSVFVYVRTTRFVLFDASHQGYTGLLTGEYRSLNQLLAANGFVVDELTVGPITSGLLSSYDALVLMDPWWDFSSSEISDIQDWVLRGGGLFAIPDGGWPYTINELLVPYGVQLTGSSGGYGTTTDIANHPITQGVGEIYVDWVQEISAVSPSTCLASITYYGPRLGFLSASEGFEVVVLSDRNAMDNNGLAIVDNTQLMLNIFNWIVVKPEHDLAVNLEAPTFLEPNTSTVLKATVYNHGLNNETDVQFELLLDGTTVNSTVIPELLIKDSYTLSFSWTPPQQGSYNITAYAKPAPNESNLQNNIKTRKNVVRPIKHVLFDQTHGTDYIYTYRAWITSLRERGYIIDTLYTIPITSSPTSLTPLEQYDVFVIPQAWYSYTADELLTIQDFVFNGGGLLVIGDQSLNVLTDLTRFAGIEWSYGGTSGVTQDITPHPVTSGVISVYLDSPSAVLYVNGTAQDLVRDSQGGIMLAVSEQPGGKVIGFADQSTLRDYSISQVDNLLLANNMVDWLSTPIRNEHELTVSLDAEYTSLELGQSTFVEYTVKNKGLNSETNVGLHLLINDTAIDSIVIPELQIGESYYAFLYWSPTEPAMYNITAYVTSVAGETNTANNVKTRWISVFFYTRAYFPHKWIGKGNAMQWHGDDNSWEYTLPFDFPFYGIPYRTLYISSNGLITFIHPDSSLGNYLGDKLAIAPAWRDWVTYDPHDIYIWENETYIGVCWDVKEYSSTTVGSFEVILNAAGVIQFNYEHFSGPLQRPATIGISNGNGHLLAEESLDLDFGNTVVFLPFLAEHDIAILSVNPSTNKVRPGDPVDIDVVVENRGDYTEDFNVTAYAFPQNSSTTASMLGSTRIYMDPPEYRFFADFAPVGYRFNVTVEVADVADLNTWQVQIYFNGTFMRATRCFEPVLDPEYVFWNEQTFSVEQIEFNSVAVGACLFPSSQPSFNGSGKLCEIEFEITAIPLSGEAYSSALIMNNPYDTFLLNSTLGEIPTVVEDGYFELQAGSLSGHIVGTVFVMGLAPGERRTLIFTWNTTDVPPAEYRIHAETHIPGETDTEDNVCYDGIVTVMPGVAFVHDVAVINVTGLSGFAYQGWVVRMVVTVANFGNTTESFTTTLYYNNTVIATLPVLGLNPNATLTLNFDWNTTSVPCQNCTVRAVASTVLGEIDTANNEFVVGKLDIKVMGDVNGDGTVDMRDVYSAVLAFRSFPGRLKWNPDCDLNRDGMVDMRDITAVVLNFRKHS
jgi:thermitase